MYAVAKETPVAHRGLGGGGTNVKRLALAPWKADVITVSVESVIWCGVIPVGSDGTDKAAGAETEGDYQYSLSSPIRPSAFPVNSLAIRCIV